MISLLLILIPLLGGLACFFFSNERSAKAWSLLAGILTLLVSVLGLTVFSKSDQLSFHAEWLGALGSSFSLHLDGMGQLLCLLTAISFPLILTATWNVSYKKAQNFFALMLLGQAGLMGVFLAADALLFYFFWELALIPMYFICSQWGGERRIPVTFKFFIYTFLGSLFMLVGILYVYAHTRDHSFDISAFYAADLSRSEQSWLFWFFFIAFAVKMPIFPFHTWQPDTYEQSPTATTMVLSGVMVKMGVFGLLRWVLPVLPVASYSWGDVVSSLAVAGMIYASLIAIRQNDLKRLVAYSSIAHVGLMCVAIFAESKTGLQGVMIQMFNHGINIIGLWIGVEWIERKYGTRKISDLGGIALQAPVMTILFVIVALANIALPLTNAFVGEFLMFTGIFTSEGSSYNVIFMVLAGVCIILAAVYTLNMVRRVFYGNTSVITATGTDVRWPGKIALCVIVILIFVAGVYPQPFLQLTNDISDLILKKAELPHLIKR